MELEQPENCAKCSTLPEDILMLTCNHDLCLTCSAKNFQKEIQKKGRAANSICCELCGALTVLDESSIQELQKIANSLPPERNKRNEDSNGVSPSRPANKYYHKSTDATDRVVDESRPTAGPKVFDQIANENLGGGQFKTVRGYCPEHPDEEISYFCFDCLSSCICPECVIHGTHKNHEVKTVKKAYPIVKAKIEEAMNQLINKIEELRGLEERVESNKLQAFDGTKNFKKQISDMFTDIRQRLDRKEKEAMQSLDKILEDSVKELDGQTKHIKNKAFSVNSSLEILQNHLASKDEALLLNFYSNNREKLLQNMSTEEISSKKLQEYSNLGHSSILSDFSEAVKGLQDNINNINIEVVAYNEKNLRRSEIGNTVLNNYNRQVPGNNHSSSQNFSKNPTKNHQNISNHHQQSNTSDYRKNDKRKQVDKNGDGISYGTFGTYGNFEKSQNVSHHPD